MFKENVEDNNKQWTTTAIQNNLSTIKIGSPNLGREDQGRLKCTKFCF